MVIIKYLTSSLVEGGKVIKEVSGSNKFMAKHKHMSLNTHLSK